MMCRVEVGVGFPRNGWRGRSRIVFRSQKTSRPKYSRQRIPSYYIKSIAVLMGSASLNGDLPLRAPVIVKLTI